MSKSTTAEDKNLPSVATAAGMPAGLADHMLADAGMGVSTDPKEVGIPYISILQDMSPQVKKRDEAYIEDAEPGMVYNNVAKEIYKNGVEFISCFFESAQVEWKPSRGGFAAKHPDDTPLRGEVRLVANSEGKMEPLLPNGNILVETKYYYGFFRPLGVEGARWGPAVIGMASSMIKCSREWQGLQKRNVIPGTDSVAPAFSRIYSLRTRMVSKNNNEWFVWDIAMGDWVSETAYHNAREFAQQAMAGSVRVSNPEGSDTTQGADTSAEEVL